ncbi:MAG: hypothetical protein NTW54_10415 [Bacteroidetes bacterium]|nr:hypothetical protein [Bacteroidota bacterium]
MLTIKKYILSIAVVMTLILLESCTKNIDIKVPQDDEKIVVEAYINNLYSNLNYVLITKTVNYFNPDFSFKGFGNALVKIGEGKINMGGDTSWTSYTLKTNQLLEGFYNNDSLIGKVGSVYKLEIWLNGKYYYSYTTIPDVVPLDSLTREIVYNGTTPRALLTVHFNEPSTIGQNYRVMLRYSNEASFNAWGDVADSNQSFFNDDNSNGVYRHFTYIRSFHINDTIQYYLATMNRTTYNFWDSYVSARQNGGPFATPIQLRSNINGENVIGCFSGYALNQKQFIFKL